MTEHTALPWERYYPWLRADDAEEIRQVTPDGTLGEIIATCVQPANARFIVTACNCHADLLEALKEIAKAEGVYSWDPLAHAQNTISNMMSVAEQAIRKAEEQSR